MQEQKRGAPARYARQSIPSIMNVANLCDRSLLWPNTHRRVAQRMDQQVEIVEEGKVIVVVVDGGEGKIEMRSKCRREGDLMWVPEQGCPEPGSPNLIFTSGLLPLLLLSSLQYYLSLT